MTTHNLPSTSGFRGTSSFSRLLSEWLRVIDHYGSSWQWNDCFWWYRERPCLSIFSGAIWRLGGVVLEEFKTIKNREDKSGYDGRCDLSFQLPDPSGNLTAYDAEAKHVWCELDGTVSRAISVTTKALEKACADVRKVKGASHRLGIVFVSFTINDQSNTDAVAANRAAWISEFTQAFDAQACSAIAWFVLDLPHHVKSPGTAVVLQVLLR